MLFFLRSPKPLKTWAAAPLLPLLLTDEVVTLSSVEQLPAPPVPPSDAFVPEAFVEGEDDVTLPVAVVILP